MALFERLLRTTKLERLEDFFTEIVAGLFESSPDLLFSWLKNIGLALNTQGCQAIKVATQVSLLALDNHDRGSRPDITIHLSDGYGQYDVIFIESKIGALEHDDQLKRYADQLVASYPNAGQRVLLYITRGLEPKDKNHILKNVPPSSPIIFEQLFWYEFCRFLQKQPPNALLAEVIYFMKINRMAWNPEATEYSAVAESGVTGLMDWTLRGDVRTKFEQAFGSVTPLQLFAGEESRLRQWGEYCLYCWLDAGHTWYCGFGYQFKNPCATEADELSLRTNLFVRPDSPHRFPIIKAMKAISQDSDWKGVDLEMSAWSGIIRDHSLADFMPIESHISQIQAKFQQMLGELIEIKQRYPDLPWNEVK